MAYVEYVLVVFIRTIFITNSYLYLCRIGHMVGTECTHVHTVQSEILTEHLCRISVSICTVSSVLHRPIFGDLRLRARMHAGRKPKQEGVEYYHIQSPKFSLQELFKPLGREHLL